MAEKIKEISVLIIACLLCLIMLIILVSTVMVIIKAAKMNPLFCAFVVLFMACLVAHIEWDEMKNPHLRV